MDNVTQLCEQLGSDDQTKAFQARRGLWVLISAAGAPGKESDRTVLASALAGELVAKNEQKEEDKKKKKEEKTPKLNAKARNQIALLLADIANDPEIPALIETLGDFDVRENARFALARIPSAAATAALAETAQKAVGVEYRVGVLGSLGRRSGSVATDALKQVADDTGVEVRLVAAESLAEQPDAAGDAIIAKIGKELGATNPRAAKRTSIARLQLAQTLAKAGQKDAARGIYQSIASDGADDAQKNAAKSALTQLG
ncbi:MAG TPA: HEAT repeat domain-containing protein [Pirellulales bacterium]|jgi:hypothetical protein